MAPSTTRHALAVPPSSTRRPAEFIRLRCEPLEDRVTPALFDIQAVSPAPTGLNNNGCVAVADFNNDGFLDAVLTNYGNSTTDTTGNKITVLYGNDSGGFARLHYTTNGTNVSFVTVADVNGDGWSDVVAVNANQQNTGSVSVFRNDGAGYLNLEGTFSSASHNPSWVGLADMTGDNVLDIVVGSFGKAVQSGGEDDVIGNNVTIFQGNADGQGKGDFTFSAGPTTTLAPEIQFIPTALAVADFNNDGIRDIAAAVPGVPPDFNSPQVVGSVYIFRGTGSGGFTLQTTLESGGALPVNIQAADLNGDNRPDLVIANAGDPNANPEFSGDGVGVILNVSSGGNLNFGLTNSLTANTYGPFAAAVADFNVDGKADIAVVNYGAQVIGTPAFVAIYQGNGTGGFSPGSPATYTTTPNIGGGQYLAVGNFNANPTPDLIVVHATNQVVKLNNTTVAPAVESVAMNVGQANLTQRSRVTSATVRFDSEVTLAAGAFTFKRVGLPNGVAGDNLTISNTGTTPPVVVSTATVNGKTVATLTFAGTSGVEFGSLADGVWELTVDRTKVQTSAGTRMLANYTTPTTGTGRIYRLFGDTDGDGRVNNADLFQFRSSFGLTSASPGYLGWCDYDGSGAVNNTDLFQFRARLGLLI